ncbi:hypothetical protein SteCoe_28830 [Stentor coeruleus]|uniref:Phosphodiesterase n=1 Tax=Stentor coeruleus TaxID=5963 RepID=A0A1R2B7C2_9CILI|nr:hypothetical protein SteCoe_28830 [Stentor coeruleus]
MISNRSEYLKNSPMVEEGEDIRKYTMVNFEEAEKLNLPVDPNLLKFYEKGMNTAYTKYQYFEKSEKALSDELYGKLWIFHLNLTLICICYIIFSLITYFNNNLSQKHLIFHLTCSIGLPILSLALLPFLKTPEVFVKYVRQFYVGLSLLVYTYFIIGNKHILNSIINTEHSNYALPMNLGIITYTITLRYVLFHNFLGILIVTICMLSAYITATLASPQAYNFSNFNEFFVVLIFSVLQVIDTQHTEYHFKKIFWMQFRNERSYKTSITNRDEDIEGVFHTETELLIQACDKIKKTLKHACSVIIFKDIKDSLKVAQVELEHVKQKIGKAGYLKEVKIEPQVDIDPEDKEFISQNYLEVSYVTPPERSAMTELTLFEFTDRTQTFPFSHYGIDKLESVLSQLGKNWSFDIWFVHDSTGQSVSILGKYLFEKWQLNTYLNAESSSTNDFFEKLEAGYHKNPYHNACHAADVLHTQLFFISQSNLAKSLTQIDIIACIISALGHDIGHLALTNRFLINNRDKIALRYNDSSVLESMHSAKTFKLLSTDGLNILKNLTNDDWMKIRKTIIEMILETDMSRHFEILGKFRTRVQTLSNMDISIFEDKCQVLGMALKCADIGHSAKDYDLHEKWSMLVCEEFFRQGDLEKERGQTVSMYCDRVTTDIPKSQAGFIKNICLPLYEIWSFYLKSETVNKFALEQLKKNLEFWSQKKKRRATVKIDERTLKAEALKRIQSSK